LRFPSVSTDPRHGGDVRNCALYLVDMLAGMGFTAELFATPGHPVVFAQWLGKPGAPTVIYYGHYDVQPPDPLELWESPPFEPTIRDGAVYARGACDDKGQVFAHIKAWEALLATTGQLPINLKVILEGEEECGSAHLADFLSSQRDRLTGNVVVVSDTAMFAPHTPTVCYGLRGLSYIQINVVGPCRDLHSGAFGGGVDNPINALCHMIGALKSPEGHVRIPGFYDDVRGLSDAERHEQAALPFDEQAFLTEAGTIPHGEQGYSTLERICARPTLDCNGIWGGFTGVGAKTVLPSQAHAKISMRLVPNQRPEDVNEKIVRYLRDIAPATVKVDIDVMYGSAPSITTRDSPYVRAASRALESVFGRPPVFVREGGSIPVVADFKRILGLDTMLVGFGLATDRIHSPNEKFDLDNFRWAMRWSTRVWEEISAEANR
jgi:acetylornithine deacetylase/succinyl-diaminopimelate desuccinylase-like protein